MKNLTDLELGWLAGLYEGEGCAYVGKNGMTRIDISSTDLDVLEKVNKIYPSTLKISVSQPKRVQAHYKLPKLRYAWRLGRPEQVQDFLELLLPHLCDRRRQRAEEVLDHLRTRPGIGGHNRAKTHCAKGHEYTVENTIIRPGTTHRRCRKCVTIWYEESRKKRTTTTLGQGTHNREKTHCPHGHEYTEENTYTPVMGTNAGKRFCRTCRKDASTIRKHKYSTSG